MFDKSSGSTATELFVARINISERYDKSVVDFLLSKTNKTKYIRCAFLNDKSD